MIDVHQPIELDDGRPAKIVEIRERDIRVSFLGNRHRNGIDSPKSKQTWWYYTDNGVFGGGNAERSFTIRNVLDEPVVEEDWS